MKRLEYHATLAAKIPALEMCRPLSKIVHPYPPTLHGVCLILDPGGYGNSRKSLSPSLFRILQVTFLECTFYALG